MAATIGWVAVSSPTSTATPAVPGAAPLLDGSRRRQADRRRGLQDEQEGEQEENQRPRGCHRGTRRHNNFTDAAVDKLAWPELLAFTLGMRAALSSSGVMVGTEKQREGAEGASAAGCASGARSPAADGSVPLPPPAAAAAAVLNLPPPLRRLLCAPPRR